MLKRDIRIGDKTPSKISLGKDEPTSICLGDKLIWGGVDDTVDVTVYIDNPEVFNEKDSSAIIHIGSSDIKVDKNHIGPFNIKAEIKNNSVRFIYDTTFNISNIHNCNVKINNTTYDTKALTEYSFDSFKKGKNEVHLTFK